MLYFRIFVIIAVQLLRSLEGRPSRPMRALVCVTIERLNQFVNLLRELLDVYQPTQLAAVYRYALGLVYGQHHQLGEVARQAADDYRAACFRRYEHLRVCCSLGGA